MHFAHVGYGGDGGVTHWTIGGTGCQIKRYGSQQGLVKMCGLLVLLMGAHFGLSLSCSHARR